MVLAAVLNSVSHRGPTPVRAWRILKAPYAIASIQNFKRFGGVVVEISKVGVVWRGAGGGVDAKSGGVA